MEALVEKLFGDVSQGKTPRKGQMEMFKNIIYKPQSSIMVGTPDCGKYLFEIYFFDSRN